ncbi:hypothetical protein KC19_VG110200 [Ceratodon purpureus]|uniref:Uncharacterized protein n=1 Tax=Ceratodon purpureus TaxID=3225 RepID=A0A8T0HP90_CERPU|nr:hypothetical protein KC19_N045600 [Ceratodon purpureus]KAG0572611.1 hypothetical protein KC19_VG110200 [Ceratodon purpureus]
MKLKYVQFEVHESYFLSEAEYGPDSQVVLVVVRVDVDITSVMHQVERQCRELLRDTIATKVLSHSYIVVVQDIITLIS